MISNLKTKILRLEIVINEKLEGRKKLQNNKKR